MNRLCHSNLGVACSAVTILVLLAALAAAAEPAGKNPAGKNPAGKNIALGAKYRLWPQPNYGLCTDKDDAVQLTDGVSTTQYFWTQKGTVGWSHAAYTTVTVDLGRVEPIAGVAYTTAAGVADVIWPGAIQILVSDDGKSFRDVGDLVALDHKVRGPWPKGYAIRRLATDELKTKGRFVTFMYIPLASGSYAFVDEVEVLRGPQELLAKDAGGRPVRNVDQLFTEGRIQRSVDHRLANDLRSLRQAIQDAKLADQVQGRLLAQLDEVQKAAAAEKTPFDRSFRAVLPLTAAHARLFQVQAQLWRAAGLPALSAVAANPWDTIDPFARPSLSVQPIQVHTMRGEYRAAALNLANSGDRTLEVSLRFEGLPESPAPGYVTVHQVEWIDTSHGEPVATALPEATLSQKSWKIAVPPGLVRQVWFTFHPTALAAGKHAGKVLLQAPGAPAVAVPIELRAWPLEFPGQTTLWLGGWSYTDGNTYGVTAKNRKQFLEHLQTRFVNAPWAGGGTMLNCKFAGDRVELNTERMDRWIAQWPKARQYMVFLNTGATFSGAKIGTPQFDRRVAAWISAWVRHLAGKGISADRLCLLIHDEPHESTDVAPLVAWAKAIRAAEPKVRIWEDPTYSNPRKAPPELFEVSHILCPNRPMWLQHGKPFAQFYLDQQRKGRTLNFYSCSGPAKLLDPYSYYRLQAWHCWQIGATGSFFWAFGDNDRSSSWNEYLAVAGPFAPLMIDDESVVPAKQMEAVRESVEDYEYFVLLRKALERAKAAGRSDAAVAKAQSLLANGASRVLSASNVEKIHWRDAKDRTLADTVRVEVLEALNALK